MKILKNVFSDIPMFLTKNSFTGDVNIKKDQSAIKESIKNIILTINHERPLDYEFGTNATVSMFENPDDFSFYVENNIALAITRYEPRVTLTKMNSTFEGKTVTLDIEYSIKDFDVRDNIRITVERVR
jgi:phage baseplate assembly protein W